MHSAFVNPFPILYSDVLALIRAKQDLQVFPIIGKGLGIGRIVATRRCRQLILVIMYSLASYPHTMRCEGKGSGNGNGRRHWLG